MFLILLGDNNNNTTTTTVNNDTSDFLYMLLSCANEILDRVCEIFGGFDTLDFFISTLTYLVEGIPTSFEISGQVSVDVYTKSLIAFEFFRHLSIVLLLLFLFITLLLLSCGW